MEIHLPPLLLQWVLLLWYLHLFPFSKTYNFCFLIEELSKSSSYLPCILCLETNFLLHLDLSSELFWSFWSFWFVLVWKIQGTKCICIHVKVVPLPRKFICQCDEFYLSSILNSIINFLISKIFFSFFMSSLDSMGTLCICSFPSASNMALFGLYWY